MDFQWTPLAGELFAAIRRGAAGPGIAELDGFRVFGQEELVPLAAGVGAVVAEEVGLKLPGLPRVEERGFVVGFDHGQDGVVVEAEVLDELAGEARLEFDNARVKDV